MESICNTPSPKEKQKKTQTHSKKEKKKKNICKFCSKTTHLIYSCRYLKRREKQDQQEKDLKLSHQQQAFEKQITDNFSSLSTSFIQGFNRIDVILKSIITDLVALKLTQDVELKKLNQIYQHISKGKPSSDDSFSELSDEETPSAQPFKKCTDKYNNKEQKIDNKKDNDGNNLQRPTNEHNQSSSEFIHSLKPLPHKLDDADYYIHPNDSIVQTIKNGQDPRLLIFHKIDNELVSISSDLPKDNKRKQRIKKRRRKLTQEEKDCLINFETEILKSMKKQQEARSQAKKKH